MGASPATLARGLSQALDLSIGCVPFRIAFTDDRLKRSATARYQAFHGGESAPFRIRLAESRESADCPADFSYEFEGAALDCRAGEAVCSGVRNEYALDSLLRVLLSWVLLPRAGFLLHAAAIVREGRAYVFTGPSGAGKSTVASLAPAGSVLTDEISLLRRENGGWRVHGTPFWGEFRAAGSNTSAPLAGIFRLVQSHRNLAGRLSAADALRMLLPNVLFFSANPDDNRLLLAILARLAAEVPFYRFEFRREPDLLEALPQ